MRDLPLVLAGPILRRVEQQRAVFWLALRDPLEARITLNDDETHLDPHFANCRLIKAAPRLNYLLIDLKAKSPFVSGEWVDYRVELKHEGQWLDVATLYPEMVYPGRSSFGFKYFDRVETVLHGSCRKPHHDSLDGLVAGDELLEKIISGQDQNDLPAHPAFLVLSGDQVYSDDVAGPTLNAIHDVMAAIDAPVEIFPKGDPATPNNMNDLLQSDKCYYGRDEILPRSKGGRAVTDMLFEGVRKPIFTTQTANNHLISLFEHLSMYLLVWSSRIWSVVDMQAPKGLSPQDAATYAQERRVIEDFRDGLGRVERLFAHVPVAMIFDDHDITDDWNLNRQWEEAVYGHDFSRRMVGNGLVAYLINQAWGNHPARFETSSLMDPLETFFADLDHDLHEEYIDEILSFEGWEYSWPSNPPLIVIDSRTRRWRSESSAVKPSGLLDWEALGDLQHKLYGNHNVLLVSPAPIFGVKLIEAIQRIFTWFGKPLVVDAENWMAHPGTASAILNIFLHSKTPRNFVILSGDVHYSFTYDVELRNRVGGPDIWQITSSGLRNEFPKTLLSYLDMANRWLYAPKSPLNWFTQRRRMRVVPRKPDGHADGRRLLNGAGIGVVELDEDGRPVRVRQLIADGKLVGFERMERHWRWG